MPIFSMIASFQDEDPGHRASGADARRAARPGGSPDRRGSQLAGLHPVSKRLFTDRPVDLRHVPSPIYLTVEGERVPRQAVWVRIRRAIPDDPAIHRAALAYLSDLTIQESILRAHGVAWATPGLKVASLDHAMWWHRPGRVDEWMLYVQESPERAGRSRSRDRAHLLAQTALLLASVAQEIMVRVPRRQREQPERFSAPLGVDDRLAEIRRPRGRCSSVPRRVGRPVAASTITTTAVARA